MMLEKIKSNPFPIKVNNWTAWNWHGASIQYKESTNIDEQQHEVVIYRDSDRFYGILNDIHFLNNNIAWVKVEPNSYIKFYTNDDNLTVFNAKDTVRYNLKKYGINFFECKYPSSLKNIFIEPDLKTNTIPSIWSEAKQDTIVY